ncbi:MAG: HlyC/CorC family transporter [Bacteroides sp.]|nr:HlyC/CorC family transporter [Bacteroides sp.]
MFWITITIISLLLSALFSGVEIAYVTSDRVRVELDINRRDPISRIISRFYANSELFISTILVGNNIVLVLYGMGTAALLEPHIAQYFPNQAAILIIQTLISTAIILITGEFFPKSIFRINPNTSLKIFAIPVYLFYIILYPISLFTTWLSRTLMHLCHIHTPATTTGALSVAELNQYLDRTLDTPTTHSDTTSTVENEVKIFHNALDFSTTHLRDCMIPRNEIIAVNIHTTTRRQLSHLFTSSGRSKIIVYSDDIDNPLGYIHVSELFDPEIDWTTRIKPIDFAPETLLANKMMQRLLQEKRSIAIVVDEFGGTAGMVTLEDLLEDIFGDIQDEHDLNSEISRRIDDNTYEFSGRCEIAHIRDTYHIDIPESDDYQTLAGYILNTTGTIPAQGDQLTLDNLTLTILRRTATRLELIRLQTTPLPNAQPTTT